MSSCLADRRIMLLMPATSYRATDFLTAARRLNAEVIVASDHAPVLAEFTGDRCLRVGLTPSDENVARIVEHARRTRVNAVLGTDDGTVELAARAAAALHLAHNSPAAVATARDKHAFRSALAAAGLPGTRFGLVEAQDDLTAVAAGQTYPCVLKPLSLSASRGVIRANSPSEFISAAERIRALLGRIHGAHDSASTTRILVETFIPGTEVAVEGLLRHGRLHVLALFDKPDPLDGPFFEETIYVTPSRLPEQRQQQIAARIADAAAAIGLTTGPIHAEARLNAHGIFVIEIAPRSIGGHCSRAVRLMDGIRLEEMILRDALALPVDPAPSGGASGVMMIPIPAAGRLRDVRGVPDARAVPGVDDLVISIPIGDELVPLPEGDRYLGFIFASGDAPAAAETSLRTAHGRLEFDIEPRRADANHKKSGEAKTACHRGFAGCGVDARS
jgi:biotin carboxylase